MLGHLQEWFYAGLAGIKQTNNSVAYKNIEIRPQPVGDVTAAKVTFISPYGQIVSDWKIINGVFELTVTVPVNTTANVYLSGSNKVIKTGSGTHQYRIKMK